MNTILLATDGSQSAHEATLAAVEIATATGWHLRVLTVWHTPTVAAYGYAPGVYVPLAELSDAEKEHAGEVVLAAVRVAAERGVEATWELRQGIPAEEICEAAEEEGVRLIVIGAHGWGAFKRLLFGSVSTGVLHHARCPVLVVRGDEHAAEREAAA